MTILLALTGVFNNCLVASVVWRTKQMKNSTNFLLANNAIAEVFYLVTSAPVTAYLVLHRARFITSATSVFLSNFLDFLVLMHTLLFCVTTMNLALLSIERYNALCNPMKIQRRLGKRGTKFCVLTMWLLAAILVLPVAINFIMVEGFVVIEIFIYFCFMKGILTIITGCVVVYCYGRIIYGIYISKTIFTQTSCATIADDMKTKKNVVKMLLSITFTFLFAKLPVASYRAIMLYLGSSTPSEKDGIIFAAHTLGHASSFLNPIIYLLFSSNYRQGALRLLKSCSLNKVSNLPPTQQQARDYLK
ncbi:prolactin-releasing peptide receptor-like [Dendronephthya gigantea]|uniref:prolactin-releasing peptide receptor-like n=1 Tax=Dendronephthya gigantea TaxID=151771 RepID=UPI00106BC564|nr:prolactin-releasing peptide receptor-like [Dendronephthya gigantea]